MKTIKFLLVVLCIGLVPYKTLASDLASLSSAQQDTFWTAVKLYQEEDFTKALQLLQPVLAKDTENVDVNFYAGMCYLNLNEKKLAKKCLDLASENSVYRLKILFLTRRSSDNSEYFCCNRK